MLDGSLIGLGLGAGLAATAAAGGMGLAFSKTLQGKVFPKPVESLLSDLLPFHHLAEDDETLVCKDGTWSKVIILQGLVESNQTEDERLAQMVIRRQWLDMMAKEEVAFSLMTHRLPINTVKTASVYSHPVLQEIDKRWQKDFERSYQTVHALHLMQKPKGKNLRPNLQRWKETTQTVLDYLRLYQPQVLKQTDQDDRLLSFWSQIINGFSDHPVKGRGSAFCSLSRDMVSSTVSFDYQEGVIEWRNGQQKLYGAVVSIQRWSESVTDRLMKQVFELPCELRLIHWLQGYNVLSAGKELKLGLDQAVLFFFNKYIQSQFSQAIEWVQSDQNSLYEIQSCLYLLSEDKEHLFEMVDKVRGIFRTQGLKPAHETQAVEALWLCQFPSFNKLLLNNKLFSQNIATLTSFAKDQEGVSSCDWGPGPLRQFKTSTGSAYDFQLHVSDKNDAVAHSLILSPSGGGKTTLFQHLISGALRHPDLQAYIFDRFGGTRIFTEAVGGKVIDLSDAGNLQINPFQCEETESNKAFLTDFLLQLAQAQDDVSIQGVGRAVEGIFQLPEAKRNLDVICHEIIELGNPLKNSLQKWTLEGTYGRYFNGEKDALDIKQTRLVNFEMGQLQGLGQVYTAVLRYFIHRIREQVIREKSPHLIFIDEAAPLLEEALFRDYVKQFLREHRRLRGSISLCFQDATGVMNSDLRDTILNQCQTVFFFPNVNAKREDFEAFSLNEQQWSFIKGTSQMKLKRGVLVKRTTAEQNEAVFLDIDMENLGSYLSLYRSGNEAVQTVKHLQQQFGPDWVPRYLGEV